MFYEKAEFIVGADSETEDSMIQSINKLLIK
jgi:hypothetical protein